MHNLIILYVTILYIYRYFNYFHLKVAYEILGCGEPTYVCTLLKDVYFLSISLWTDLCLPDYRKVV